MNRKEKEACGRAWKRYRNSGKPEVDWAAEQHAFFAGWAAASGVIRRRIEKMTAPESLADKYNRTVSLMGDGKNYVADSDPPADHGAELSDRSATATVTPVGSLLNADRPTFNSSLDGLDRALKISKDIRREYGLDASDGPLPPHPAEFSCPYCIKRGMGCYYDQNCIGCVKRMGAARAELKAEIESKNE